MHNEFTVIIEQDEEWFTGYCPEIPSANGQGRTVKECRENLVAAISLILEDQCEDACLHL
jgi:predicted RNase H-like HicB family nuclease